MHFSPHEVQTMMEERVQDALREAQQERLRRMANPMRPRVLDRVAATVVSLLLSAGKKLQERQPPVETGLTISPSPHKQRRSPAHRSDSRSSGPAWSAYQDP
jgi:signal transduction histidine kinase